MLSEIGISEEVFAEACIKATANPTHKMLLSEIMAVDNFLAFKKLMLKRNKELSEEAYQLMKANEAGINPDLLYENQPGSSSNEDAEIARAIQESLRLEEQNKASTPALSEEEEMLRKVMEESKREYEQMESLRKAQMEENKKEPEPKANKEPKKEAKPAPKKESTVKEDSQIKAPKSLAPIGAPKAAVAADFDIQKHAEETKKQHAKMEEQKKKDLEKKTMTKEEMKERMEKLKKQRDLLVQRKQAALQKEWDNYGDEGSGEGGSRKDMIKKGLDALAIKEGDAKYKTQEQKQLEKELKEKQKEEAKKER